MFTKNEFFFFFFVKMNINYIILNLFFSFYFSFWSGKMLMQSVCAGSIETCRNSQSKSIATASIFLGYVNIVRCSWSFSSTQHCKCIFLTAHIPICHFKSHQWWFLFPFWKKKKIYRCVKNWNECIQESIWIYRVIYHEHHLVNLKKLTPPHICWMPSQRIYSRMASVGRK